MTTNAERQAAYKERMRKAGYQQVTLWIQPERKKTLLQFADGIKNAKGIDVKTFEAITGILQYHCEK